VPVLSIQFSGGQAQQSDGTIVQLPPGLALIQRGPILQVSISVGQAVATQILQAGGTLPAPATGLALIDTGASMTCVDDAAAAQLNLPVIDVVNIASASHASSQANIYPIQIEVIGAPIVVAADRAAGAALAAQGLLALIGRDVLQHCMLVYNGVTGSFSIAV